MSITSQSIAVLGAGSWGTALALLLANNQSSVKLWGYSPSFMQQLKHTRENPALPGFILPESIQVCAHLNEALQNVAGVLIVVPSHAFVALLQQMLPFLVEPLPVAWGTKGLAQDNQLLSVHAEKILGQKAKFCVLSGPSFSIEVAQKQPTAITAASLDDSAYFWQQQLHGDYFRVYTTSDMIGTQLGGAWKNVLAIAVGIADGLGFGSNTKAALMTRGFAELLRLGRAMGAQDNTLMGLSGMGDLILTCGDNQSRNRRFGVALGQGQNKEQIKKTIGQVVEGEQTTLLIHQLAKKLNIEMPITEQVYNILFAGQNPGSAVKQLLDRTATEE